jgi:hypothetical protein
MPAANHYDIKGLHGDDDLAGCMIFVKANWCQHLLCFT